MALTPLVPAAVNAQVSAAGIQVFKSSVVKDFSGAALDLSAFVSLQAQVYSQNAAIGNNPTSLAVLTTTPTADSAGVITVETAPADMSTLPASGDTLNLVIVGKPTSGDALQILATGSIKYNAF